MPGKSIPGIVELPVRRWRDGAWEEAIDAVADEVPVALTFNSIPHVVMLATPADLTDLGRGFSFTEALVESPDEIRAVELKSTEQGLEVALAVPQQRLAQLLDAIRVPAAVVPGGAIERQVLVRVLSALKSRQELNMKTGSLHAAAWVGWDGDIRLVREDVGRHNALDKVIGALLGQRADREDGLLVVTSRASYEMVQKAATAGIRMLVAVSAPTALAIRLADRTGLTLVGFARESQQVVYTHPERLA
jgi:FdhD protein